MKRVVPGVAAAAVAGLALFWAWPREPAPVVGPAVIPAGETREVLMPGPEGEPEVWTLRRRDASREELDADDLPAPAPRAGEPDAATDSARALHARALEAWKVGDLRGALDHFENAVAADPEDWVPRADYGRLLVLMTAYEDALPHLEKAAALNPDSPRVWVDLYSYYQRTLQLDRAFKARRRAEELAGDRAIVQDATGIWRLEDDSIFP